MRDRGEAGSIDGMSEIVFVVSQDEETGVLVAAWDDPSGGGITTQGVDLEELQHMVRDAVACHFAL